MQQSRITGAQVSVFTVPTDAPEADGTFAWDHTTMVLVELTCGSVTGLGYTYADESTGKLVQSLLREIIEQADPWQHAQLLARMYRRVRNLGICGIATMAIAAIDTALWDLRARLLNLPLVTLFGRERDGIAVYGSGGFTSYDDAQLRAQFTGWAQAGFGKVKMKVGSHPDDDPRRVQVARAAIGAGVELFVDANGAYTVQQALRLADTFFEQGVTWFEEPVSSDNLTGLRQVRERVPAGMDVAAGEYGYSAFYFQRMIDACAVQVLQADATRCAGFSGFLDAAALCWAANLPLSSHCAPSLHLHVCCAVPRAVHMEFFHDHARIERMFFDGFCEPRGGVMYPDLSRSGMGLTFKAQDAEKFRV